MSRKLGYKGREWRQIKIFIFGAGQIGRMALAKWKEYVLFIVDHNKNLQGV